jgi:hypothetical protein
MLAEQVASLSTEQHYAAQYINNSKKMCPRPAFGEKSTCNKPFPGRKFLLPKKDAEKKVEVTNKLPVLKF